MTYREAIKKLLRKPKEDSNHKLPFALAELFRSFTLVLLSDTDYRLKNGVPDGGINGWMWKGKAVEKPEFMDYVRVLSHADLLRGMAQSCQLINFLNWLLDHEAVNTTKKDEYGDEYEVMWYEAEIIGELWNEFPAMEIERRANGE